VQHITSMEGDSMEDRILMAHGSGGKLAKQLTEEVFLPAFGNSLLAPLEDASVFSLPRGKVGMTTDSYVVKPLFFPGGDIGRLAVSGTVNDLAVSGAVPMYLSAGFILEEGLPLSTLKRVVSSMAATAREAGVKIITGDTKVVEKGMADGLYINTAGVGWVDERCQLGAKSIRPGDQIIVTGSLGEHGVAILAAREGLELNPEVLSDVAPLNKMLQELLETAPGIKAMRDPTRGGLVTTLNEWAETAGVAIRLKEENLTVLPQVAGACELFGFDPLYLANEGKAVIALPAEEVPAALKVLHRHHYGKGAAVVGEVTGERPGMVILETSIGGQRIIDMLAGEQLPRIC
jgi:hydrogenase expression/formation protein HypE